ncbi:valine--tRNA ligase [Granulicella mallensis]|uniref:Valine--tRNA ligase n=1 Tax=Granulicella mallensis (strain ATCC BAA-1857 / DSM 23137 / MP5ACTX8) TaxID=682795 RepID=G8NWK8_GRAMM|nr:valine--tRNA ligase [Granulicella mallensis]AEU38895.1 valyl-tRNA synthetase [Granulicella mallensis MP5ACTX8]
MNQELPKTYDPSSIEEKWAKFWVEERLFDVATPAGEADPDKTFVQLLPPPNVTGRLHMGHMLNQTEMDILTRWHRMRGDTSVWVPGTDHAGIATQMMVERQLAAEGTTTRQQLGREAFTERVWKWKEQYGGAITDQMRRLGASVDWSREYFTMDERLSRAVKESFVRLYEQGLIYRGAYIVNWDPQIQTAVSDLEVESEERAGSLFHIRYDLADGSGSLIIATTRPETMLGDVAVAVNPTDERYTAFLGKNLVLPLMGREIPVVADDWANPEFGTGAVKVTPAHDPNDFAIGRRHNLPSPNIMDERAHIKLEGSPYDGLDRFEARKRIVADLEAAGHLVAIKDHTLTLPVSQRTGAIIEPRLSMQWFLKIQPLADKAIEAVDKGYIKFTPDNYRKTYGEWMKNIHDWCISRQLWWGHRIPAWHCGDCGAINVSRETPTDCTKCGGAKLVQETDVLDTWFSSGLLPFTVFGWDGSDKLTPDLAAFYPTQLLVTGFDILFFWVARMIMLGCHFMLDVPMPDGSQRSLADAVPFREVYIHALVRDADRQKMSKTKGNVIDPIEVVTKYGTDAVRFTLASQASPGTDIAFSEARTEGYRSFANKIWNAARFLQMQIERGREAGYKVSLGAHDSLSLELPEQTPLETRWIFARLSTVCADVERSLADYRFDEAANAVYQFFWGEFCDWYLELVKLRLEFTGEKNDVTALTLGALVSVFEAALRLLSPFMPFITEELWHALYASVGNESPAKSIALTRFPQAGDFANDALSVEAMNTLQELIVTVRGLRKELGVPEKEATPIQVHANNRISALADANSDMLARLARVSSVELVHEAPTGNSARATANFDVAVIYERQIDVAAERERLEKDLAKYDKGLQAAERQLNNEGFVAKAPAHIVEGLKKQAAETRALKDKAQAALDALPAV